LAWLGGRQFLLTLTLIGSALLIGCGSSPDEVFDDREADLSLPPLEGSGAKDAAFTIKEDGLGDAGRDGPAPVGDLARDLASGPAGDLGRDLAGDLASGPVGDLGGDLASGGWRLRVMAANTTTGTRQSYDPGEGLRIFQGVHPDVALIQEFNYGDNSDTAIRGFVNTAFGASFSYYRERGAQIPNGVASRYPILASGSWTDPRVSNRSFAWARIDIPGTPDLWAVSVHLLTSSASNRDLEAKALVVEIQKAVPAGDYLVIGGDLNSGSRTEACLTSFSAVVSTAAPFPADNLGNENTSGSRSKPHDWVMPSPNLRSYETAVTIGAHSFANGLVVDSRVYAPISELSPVMMADSAASNMQHMAVVEDFMMP
jgi:endonuclease/exonuclease/phosphatase family metal-dependent hydrolase